MVNLSKDLSVDVATLEHREEKMKSLYSQQSDEYWIVIGMYIEAIWQQLWIKEIFVRRKGLFSVSDNMDYFFDKARVCMSAHYQVTEEVKLIYTQ